MPDAVLVEVADAIVTLLKAGSFCKPFDPVRTWGYKATELKKIKTLLCDVVPVSHINSDDETRGHLTYDTAHDIVLRYRFDRSERDECGVVDVAEVDSFVLLMEQIHEYTVEKTLGDANASEWKESRILWSPKKSDLQEFNQFTGLVRVTFTTSKEQP